MTEAINLPAIRSFSLSDDGALEHLFSAAQKHGEFDDPDHEVGDLQDLLRDVWGRLSEDQKRDFLESDAAANVLEVAGCSGELPYIHGAWTHLFGSGRQETTVHLVYGLKEERIVAMQIQDGPSSDNCVPASRAEIDDVEDSLKNANPEALENPEDYGLSRGYVLPVWAGDIAVPAAEVRRDAPRG